MRHVQATAVVLLCAVLGAAAPPKPAAEKVTVSVGELSRVEVTPDAAGVVGWASGAGDADLFVDELAPRGGKTRLLVQAKKAGTYRVILWTKGETDSTFVEIVAGGGSPPVTDPGKPDPKPDPVKPEPATVFYFAVIGPSGPVAPSTAAALKLPAWDELRKAGHVVNYIPVDELNPELPRPGMTPVVMVLKKDGDKWKDTANNKPLPTTDEQVRSLIK